MLHCAHAEFEGIGEREERAGQECFDGHLNGPLRSLNLNVLFMGTLCVVCGGIEERRERGRGERGRRGGRGKGERGRRLSGERGEAGEGGKRGEGGVCREGEEELGEGEKGERGKIKGGEGGEEGEGGRVSINFHSRNTLIELGV